MKDKTEQHSWSVLRRKDEEDVGPAIPHQDHELAPLVPDGYKTEASYGSSPTAESHPNGSESTTTSTNFKEWAAKFDADFSLWECLYLTLILLAIGVAVFTLLVEKWSIIDSLYFTLVLLTTVGYGDIAPVTPAGKIFTVIFAIGGVFVIGLALGVVGSELVDSEIDVLIERASSRESRESSSSQASLLESWGKFGQICSSVIRILSPIFVGAFIIAYLEGWPWYDAFYYTVITATTVGLGDLSPRSKWSEACAIAFIPLAVAAMAHILDECTTFVMRRRREKRSKKLETIKMTEEDIHALDGNVTGIKNGEVGILEYVEFMLKAMDKADDHLFKELHKQFDKLDANTDGVLTKKDIERRVEIHLQELTNSPTAAM